MYDPETMTGTAQEIFDFVARHLFTQGHRSMRKTEKGIGCAYRGEFENDACSVGCLIPDGVYHRAFEGNSVRVLVDLFDRIKPLQRHKTLLSVLQHVHDDEINWRSTFAMRGALRAFTPELGVSAAVVDRLCFSWDPNPQTLLETVFA